MAQITEDQWRRAWNTPPKFATDVLSGTGSVTVVPAVTGKQIVVLSYFVAGDTTSLYNFTSNAGFISGLATLDANTNHQQQSPYGLFATTKGHDLRAAFTVSGNYTVTVTYIEV